MFITGGQYCDHCHIMFINYNQDLILCIILFAEAQLGSTVTIVLRGKVISQQSDVC